MAKLTIALALTSGFMFVEAAMSWISGSLALLADAGHMLSDSAALVLALFAQHIARQPRSATRTFGARRAEVLAAFVNGIALGVTALLIAHEAVLRVLSPQPVRGGIMLVTAAGGLLVNLGAAAVLGAGGRDNPNIRAAFFHVLSDALGSVGAMVAGVVVILWGWVLVDPIVSMLLALLILYGAWRLVRETTAVLMEGTPPHVDVHDVEHTIVAVSGVGAVHDLHIWTISQGFDALSAHVVLDGTRHGTEVVHDVVRAVHDAHGIEHATIQPEAPPPGLVQITTATAGGDESHAQEEEPR